MPDFFLSMGNPKKIFGLGASERAKGKHMPEALFSSKAFVVMKGGFRMSYVFTTPSTMACRILVISSRKKQKTAVSRNRRKRLLRELYRLNKLPLLNFLQEKNLCIALSINFVGVAELAMHAHTPDFQKAIQSLILDIEKNTHSAPPAIG